MSSITVILRQDSHKAESIREWMICKKSEVEGTYRTPRDGRNAIFSLRDRRMKHFAMCGVGVVLVLGVIGMIVGLLSPIFQSGGTKASATTNFQSSTTASTAFIWWSTAAPTSPAVVTIRCPAGYTRSPLGTCVNLMTDFSNCGSLGYVCSSIYTNCSAGRCSGTVYVPVFTNISVTVWDDSSYYDDGVVTISLPLNITMYGQTTNNVSLSINGVSHSFSPGIFSPGSLLEILRQAIPNSERKWKLSSCHEMRLILLS